MKGANMAGEGGRGQLEKELVARVRDFGFYPQSNRKAPKRPD